MFSPSLLKIKIYLVNCTCYKSVCSYFYRDAQFIMCCTYSDWTVITNQYCEIFRTSCSESVRHIYICVCIKICWQFILPLLRAILEISKDNLIVALRFQQLLWSELYSCCMWNAKIFVTFIHFPFPCNRTALFMGM